MRQQNWAIGGRYMLPVGGLLKSENIASSLSDFKNHIKEGGKIMMTTSINLDKEPAIIETKMTIDLNNKIITGGVFAESGGAVNEGSTDSYAFWVKEGGELTIDGDGIVKSQDAQYSMAVWAQGGKVTINGGKFINEGEGSDLIYVSAGGQVIINGGEFHPNQKQEGVTGTADKYTALNIKDRDRDTSSIIVYGGKFYNFNPADNKSEGPGTNFVAEGYESIEIEPNVWEVRKIESIIDSTKMYYGTIVSPKFKSFSELTETDVNSAIKAGTLKESSVKTMQTTVNIKNEGDAVVILLPSTKYKAYKDDGSGSNKIPFNEVNSGSNFHANGEVKLGKFSVFGEWYIVPGNLVIYVE